MRFFESLRQYKEIIVVSDYTFSGGGARPIYAYYRHQVSQGRRDILLLRLALRNSYLKLLLLVFFRNRFVINGIGAFYFWPVHIACFFKKNTVLYLHEAEPHVAPFRQNNPVKHGLFKRFLRTRKVAFVSEWQQRYFAENYALGKTKVVYNAMPMPVFQRGQKVNIVMVAYQTKNKNVDFFSKVADLAAEKNLPYQFHWIGGDGGDSGGLYHSPNVNWMGDQEQLLDLLNHFDVLFFPSKSDTFGLVLMEALYKGLRVVSYKENGLAAHVKDLPGCRIFETFDEAKVLHNIAEVLAETVDDKRNQALAQELCSVGNLEKRLEAFFRE